MDVTGRNAVVTGAAGGIGAALSAELTSRGARVLLADIDPAVAQTAEGLGQEHWAGDVSSVDGVADLLDTARARLGEIDLTRERGDRRRLRPGGRRGLGHDHRCEPARAHPRAALIPD